MKINTVPKTVWRDPLHFIAFGCGVGAMPFAPGTFGTLATIPLYLLMSKLSLSSYFIITFALFIFSVWLCDRCSKQIGVHDHGGMVIDEVVGYLVTMFAAPAGWAWVLLGFILFRIFDIWKPWIIGYVDRNVGGGFGMIFDDVLAALFSWIIIQGLAWGFHVSPWL